METNLNKNTHISSIYEKLKQDGFTSKEEKFDHFDVIVAAGQQFKMSWFKATQVNIFAIMGVADKVTKEFVEAYSKVTQSYAMKNYKSFPKQMNSITVNFPLLISSTIEDDARQWIRRKLQSQLGFHEIPIILDTNNNNLLLCDKTYRSSGNYKFFDSLIQKYFQL
jgi:hypothetical protein